MYRVLYESSNSIRYVFQGCNHYVIKKVPLSPENLKTLIQSWQGKTYASPCPICVRKSNGSRYNRVDGAVKK